MYVCMYVCMYIHIYTYTYIHTYMLTHITHIHEYIHVYKQIYIHTYIHTISKSTHEGSTQCDFIVHVHARNETQVSMYPCMCIRLHGLSVCMLCLLVCVWVGERHNIYIYIYICKHDLFYHVYRLMYV